MPPVSVLHYIHQLSCTHPSLYTHQRADNVTAQADTAVTEVKQNRDRQRKNKGQALFAQAASVSG